MWKNCFVIAVRKLLRDRLYAIINILGLAIGLGGCLLIAGFVWHELNFEDVHQNKDRIYRLSWRSARGGSEMLVANAAAPLALALKDQCPEVEKAARLRCVDDVAMRVDQQVFTAGNMLMADAEILEIFSLPLLHGNPRTALSAPFSVLISERIAEKCFGNSNPVGHSVRVAGRWDCQVTGVLRKIPTNTQMQFDLIGSYSSLEASGETVNDWGALWDDYIYLLLHEHATAAALEAKIPSIVREYVDNETAAKMEYFLQPLDEIHLYPGRVANELEPKGSLTLIYLSISVALLVLLIGCVNFVNLSTARASRRMREVGLRKVLGANRIQLCRQFLGESVFVSMMAMLLGLVLFELGKPVLSDLMGRDLNFSFWKEPTLILFSVGLVLIVGLLAGSYPALFLSKLSPMQGVRGISISGMSRAMARRCLVVAQFSVAVALTALTALIYGQVDFCKNRKTGFERDDIVVLKVYDRDRKQASSKCTLLKEELLRSGKVAAASASFAAPGEGRVMIMEFKDVEHPEKEAKPLQIIPVDYDYLDFYGLTLLEGRRFSKEIAEDNGRTFIVSEAAAKSMGLTRPVGANLVGDLGQFKVIGTLRNFSVLPATYSDIPPILKIEPDLYSCVALRLPAGDFAAQITDIESIWRKVLPDEPFNYGFLEDVIARHYQDQARMGTMGAVFAAIAVFVACLGVLGLASFTVEQRFKEIGIRKVLGASAPRLIWMLGKETLALVVAANLLAAPLVWYVGNIWLEKFPHRIGIGTNTLVGPGCLVLVAAIITVGILAFRAAIANPVESLKYE